MKRNRYFALFVVTIMLCSTLVACSSDEIVYNDNFTENPSIDVVKNYNMNLGIHAGSAKVPYEESEE